MLVAITVVPTACSRFLVPQPVYRPKQNDQIPILVVWGQSFSEKLLDRIDWLLHGLKRRLIASGLILAVAFGIIFGLTPKAEYLPEGEESKTFSSMFAPPGYNLDEMISLTDQMHAFLVPHLNGEPNLFATGQSDVPALKFIVSYARTDSNLFIVETKAREQIDDLIKVLSKKFAEVPGVISFSSRGSIFAGNRGGTRSINLDISGPELERLFETGLKVFEKSKEIFDQPQVRPQPSKFNHGTTVA